MNTEELKKYALAAKLRPDLQVEQVVYRAAANPAAILALIAEIARFTQDAEMAAASLNLLTGHYERLLAEFDRITKQRDELLESLKSVDNAAKEGKTPIGFAARAFRLLSPIRAAIAKAEADHGRSHSFGEPDQKAAG